MIFFSFFYFQILYCTFMSLGSWQNGVCWEASCSYLFYISVGLLHEAVAKAREQCSFVPEAPPFCYCPESSFLSGHL